MNTDIKNNSKLIDSVDKLVCNSITFGVNLAVFILMLGLQNIIWAIISGVLTLLTWFFMAYDISEIKMYLNEKY